MSLYKELQYTSKIREISGVQFSILSPEEIKRRGVVNLVKIDGHTVQLAQVYICIFLYVSCRP